VPFGCGENGWRWLGTALRLWSLAPRLAPRDLFSKANVRKPGSDAIIVPVKKAARGELDPDTKTRNALLRSPRYQGERGFALMSQRWRALQRFMLSPTTIGDITKSVLVLVQFEHKMIS
jgi:DDE superfamily endonuclease